MQTLALAKKAQRTSAIHDPHRQADPSAIVDITVRRAAGSVSHYGTGERANARSARGRDAEHVLNDELGIVCTLYINAVRAKSRRKDGARSRQGPREDSTQTYRVAQGQRRDVHGQRKDMQGHCTDM
jgi:hypothetical protein